VCLGLSCNLTPVRCTSFHAAKDSLCPAGGDASKFDHVALSLNGSRLFETHHSHSIVPGGFDVTSYTTRLTPFTSLMMRVATAPIKLMSNG
jgi:hypothetical protein